MTAKDTDNVGGLPKLLEPVLQLELNGFSLSGFVPTPFGRNQKLTDGTKFVTLEQARAYGELCRAAPAGGDVPFDTVRSVCRALTRLGHSTPESQEEQAARSVELVNTLCREVQSHFDSLDSAPAGSGEVGELIDRLETEARLLVGCIGRSDQSSDVRALRDAAALLRKLQQGAE